MGILEGFPESSRNLLGTSLERSVRGGSLEISKTVLGRFLEGSSRALGRFYEGPKRI